MNGFDVRAIGWVVTGDACADIARTLDGPLVTEVPNRARHDRIGGDQRVEIVTADLR